MMFAMDFILSVVMVTFGMWIATSSIYLNCEEKHQSKLYFGGKIKCEVTEQRDQ